MSFGNDSPVSSYSSSSVSISPPPSPSKISKALVQTKPTHGGATSSFQRPSRSKPSITPTKPPSKTTKAIATLHSKTLQPKTKTTPKPKPNTPSRLRQRPSSTATSKPYTKPGPPPFFPNITLMGATHDPLPAYLHNAPSLAVHPPPPLSIQPQATIYPVDSDVSSQSPRSPIVISSPRSPHTPSGTPPLTPPRLPL
ncbi:proline-rich receptor-like protein kinase PERK2 [Benincasa hispida]|uniref:proline-rich receptor-like protein kinase PERK2 n=1 Tax=Benincasa hispida TaxID=102211 RepID=UPI0018FFEEFC|nr:proline-rich receptor-like protein kinase PERK2 [Benincasa hispida]